MVIVLSVDNVNLSHDMFACVDHDSVRNSMNKQYYPRVLIHDSCVQDKRDKCTLARHIQCSSDIINDDTSSVGFIAKSNIDVVSYGPAQAIISDDFDSVVECTLYC